MSSFLNKCSSAAIVVNMFKSELQKFAALLCTRYRLRSARPCPMRSFVLPQLRPKLRADTMRCVTFATPPVVTRDVAIGCEDYVTTVVHQVIAMPCVAVQSWACIGALCLHTFATMTLCTIGTHSRILTSTSRLSVR